MNGLANAVLNRFGESEDERFPRPIIAKTVIKVELGSVDFLLVLVDIRLQEVNSISGSDHRILAEGTRSHTKAGREKSFCTIRKDHFRTQTEDFVGIRVG